MSEYLPTLIECVNITKRYPGFTLGPLSFALNKAEILGLVGRNGAGKSTLLRCILRLAQIDEGAIRVLNGIEHDTKQLRNVIGYISDRPVFYEWMTVSRAVQFFSEFYSGWDSKRVNELLEILELDIKKKIKDLSTGNRLKLSLLLCLSQGARILILDEPTSGLDPIVREDLLQLIKRGLGEQWVESAIFASHVLSEVAAVATRVAVLQSGKIVDEFKLADLERQDIGGVAEGLVGKFSERCLEAMR